jgi:exonuclease SbcC
MICRSAFESISEELFENAQFDVENLTKEIKGYQDDLNADNQKLGRLKARMKILEEHEVEAEKVKAEVEPIAKKISQLTTLIEAFGMDGIPFAIVRVIVPEMRDQANKILWEMTGGNMSLDIKDSRVQKSNNATVNAIEVYVTDAVRGTMPYASRSGGQRVKAALAVAIALAMIKAQRAGIRLGMIFIDEPPFMDDEGKKAYCDTLELMANKFPDMKILAISHEGQMKARFPQQIDVTDDIENGSKAVLSVA